MGKEINRGLIFAAGLLAARFALAPGGEVVAHNPSINSEPTEEDRIVLVEEELKEYGLPLEIIRKLLDFKTNPVLKKVYDGIRTSPSDHIQIVKSSEAANTHTSDRTKYYIFLENEDSGEINPYWSMQISVDNSSNNPKNASIALVIDRKLDYFNGEKDNLARRGEVPFDALAMQADLTFNIPREMLHDEWRNELSISGGLLYIDKEYRDKNGNIYTLRIRHDNTIIFSAPHPLPEFPHKFEDPGIDKSPNPIFPKPPMA